jgi:hypothetical protein
MIKRKLFKLAIPGMVLFSCAALAWFILVINPFDWGSINRAGSLEINLKKLLLANQYPT